MPVGIVAIHRNLHAAAAGSNLHVEITAAQLAEEGLEGFDVIKRAGFRYITPVEQDMHTHGLDAFLFGAHDHCLEVIDMAMHVTVGKQANEMDATAARFGAGDDLLPRRSLPDGAGGNGVGNQRSALAIHLPRANGVVPNFGIPHIIVGRHPHGRPVRTQLDVGIIREQAIERRLARGGNGIADFRVGQAIAVHDDSKYRPLHASEGSEFLQHDDFL